MSQTELGAFLRARREAVTPLDVGLPAGGRRRTPGLRRSELATLAGISVEYLIRLEQGRDRHPSIQVLAALADALRLSADERVMLRNLVKAGEHDFVCPAAVAPGRDVRPTVRAVLERLEPAAAVVVNRVSDVLAFTHGYGLLNRPLGVMDDEQPNLLRFAFTHPRAREVYPEWDRVADRLVADLRFGASRSDPFVDDLVGELADQAGAAFTDRFGSADIMPERSGVDVVLHPEVGEMRLAFETLQLPDVDDLRIVVHLPEDEPSAAAIDRLSGRRPGALRVVSG